MNCNDLIYAYIKFPMTFLIIIIQMECVSHRVEWLTGSNYESVYKDFFMDHETPVALLLVQTIINYLKYS